MGISHFCMQVEPEAGTTQTFKGYDTDPQGHPDIEQSKYVHSYVKIFQQYKKNIWVRVYVY